MLHQDYLMRLLVDFAAAIRRSLERAEQQHDPETAAYMLEAAIGNATDIDGAVLLSLSPESMASILEVSGTEPAVTEYLSRSLLLAARYLAEAGNVDLAQLREAQAYALAQAYGHDLSGQSITPEELETLFDQLEG